MERDRDPVIITRDRIIEIPQVMEKIVEKIVIMPQVVEILKYVHELIEDDGMNINIDVSQDGSCPGLAVKQTSHDRKVAGSIHVRAKKLLLCHHLSSRSFTIVDQKLRAPLRSK